MSFIQILLVIAPVFLVIGVGHVAVRGGLLTDAAVDGVMRYANYLAFPVLLFSAIARMDLSANYNPALLATFYLGSTNSFILAMLGARYIFKRDWQDAVVIGFGGLFTNAFLLGIPISERALGADALGPNFAIISVHSPYCYTLGVIAMEIARAEGKGIIATLRAIGASMIRNPLIIAIVSGFTVNLSGIDLPKLIWDAVDLIARGAVPAALVALGGVLTRYNFGRSLGAASMVATLSLIVHPMIVFLLGTHVFHLDDGAFNSALLTAAMAPGVNIYIFATIYQRAMGAAASTLILATSLSVITVSAWMLLLR